jgi:cysteine-rich repeat protein
MDRARLMVVVWALAGILTSDVAAVDRPVAGDRLLLKDTGSLAKRRFKFRAARDAGLDPTTLADPTTLGATLEVVGATAGDGASGVLTLDPGLWQGLGNPAGSRGYKYVDRNRTVGVKRLLLTRAGTSGGTLDITGGGATWPYAVDRAQGGPIDVRFTIGDDVMCARFSTFAANGDDKVKSNGAQAPTSCDDAQPAPVCGDGVTESPEQCDDGGTADGDGCSSTCQLENPSDLCEGVPTTPGTALDSVLFLDGLERPVHLTAPPGDVGRVLITEQRGRVRVVQVDGTLLETPFLDIDDLVSCCGERGLLSVAFHPAYATNGHFFVNYTDNAGNTVIARYQVSADPQVADRDSAMILLTITQPFDNHNGGQVAFGPDGFLYVGMGDGGDQNDPDELAQNPGELLGKMLRLDVNRAGPPWGATTNPFHDGGATLPLDEIWSIGFRNPWRFSFDRLTGELYIGDVGQDNWEEIDVEPAGGPGGLNYGWDVFEGDGHCVQNNGQCTAPNDFVTPVLEYTHEEGCSVTGGFVYRGCAMPDLRGTYFYSDYCTPFIRTFKGVVGGEAQNQADRTTDLAPGNGRAIDGLSSFGEDGRGELYMLDLLDGEVFKIVPGT